MTADTYVPGSNEGDGFRGSFFKLRPVRRLINFGLIKLILTLLLLIFFTSNPDYGIVMIIIVNNSLQIRIYLLKQIRFVGI